MGVRIAVSAGAVLALAAGCSQGSSDDVLASSGEQATAQRPAYAVPVEGSVTREQSERRGVDAREACSSPRVLEWLTQEARSDSQPQYLAGFLTDEQGLALWGAEMQGGRAEILDPAAFGEALSAICWFRGGFVVSAADQDEDLARVPARNLVLTVPLGSDLGPPQVTIAVQDAVGVVPPRPPKGGQRPVDGRYPQPSGVSERAADPAVERR